MLITVIIYGKRYFENKEFDYVLCLDLVCTGECREVRGYLARGVLISPLCLIRTNNTNKKYSYIFTSYIL